MTEDELVRKVQAALDTEWPILVLVNEKGEVRDVHTGFGTPWVGWRAKLQAAGVPCALQKVDTRKKRR